MPCCTVVPPFAIFEARRDNNKGTGHRIDVSRFLVSDEVHHSVFRDH